MKTFFQNMTSRLLTLLAAITLALAQGGAQAQSAHLFSQQELDQMLAPIALYPDALLSQILMAATYPLEVVEAARWSRARPGLSGDAAVRAAEDEDWDPSVKSLVAFPQVLERMDEHLQWTQALGDAFLDQQAQVMDTVQLLRRRAAAAGSLRSDERLRVYDSGAGLMLEPLNPELVYVPYYDPLVVYGPWWWPAYPPFHWRPWNGYYARPGYASGYFWGPPVGISVGFFFGACDWTRREVRVVRVNTYYYRHSVGVNRAVIANRAPGAWRHEPERRRGVAYRGMEAQRRFGVTGIPQRQGDRVRPADARTSVQSIDVRPAVPPVTRPETRFDGRRADTRSGAQTRPPDGRTDLAPAATPVVRPDARSDGRRPDARPGADTRANVPPVPMQRPAPADRRFDRRQDIRGAVQPAAPAPAMQQQPVAQPAPAAPVIQHQPVARPAPPAPVIQHQPVARPAPPATAVQHQPIARPAPPPVIQHRPTTQPAAVAPAAPASGGQRQGTRNERSARHEAQRAGEAAVRHGGGTKPR